MIQSSNTKRLKFLALLLSLLIIFSSFQLPMVMAESLSATTTATVHVRDGASLSAKHVTYAPSGTSLTVLDTSNSDWYKVQLSNGTQGYIYAQYIKLSGSNGSSAGGFTAKATAGVNLRTGAGTNFSRVTVIAKGTVVTVTDTSNSAWYKVTLSSGVSGYISSEYLEKTTTSPSTTPAPSTTPDNNTSTAFTASATSYVNVRSGPSTSDSKITTVSPNTVVTVTDTSNGTWYKVTLSSGQTGYMHSDYLKKIADVATTPVPSVTPSPSTTPSPTPLPSPSVTPTPTNSFTAKATAYVNVRTGAGTNYSKVATISPDTQVTVTDTSNGTWYKVTLSSGKTGYIHSDYLEKVVTTTPSPSTTPTTTPTPTPAATYQAKVTATVNFRDGMSTSSAKIGLVSSGTVVTVINDSNSQWFKVQLSSGKQGYIYAEYIEKIDTTATPSPAPSVTPSPSVSPTPSTSPDTTPTTDYVKTTASSGLRLRSSASSSGSIITTISKGTILQVLEIVDSTWIKVLTNKGQEGYVASAYTEEYTGGISGGSATISATKASVSQYQTLYLSAKVSSGTSVWSSSDESIATVKNGFVYAKKPGTVTITVKDTFGGTSSSCAVTIGAPEAVRFAYPEENSPVANKQFNLVAITDTNKTSVKFELSNGQTVTSTTYKEESQTSTGYDTNTIRIFTAPVTLPAGSYTVKAYSDANTSAKQFSIYVGVDPNVATAQTRLASSEIMDIIANFEGFSATVYLDNLAYDIPTVGYGLVVYENETFYNNLTKTEAMAQLVNSINTGSYTKAINDLAKNNNILMTQQQFDALISFTYNTGTAWTTSSTNTLKKVLLSAADYASMNISESTPQPAKVTVVNTAFADKTTSSAVVSKSMPVGTALNVTGYHLDETTKELWYSVTSSTFSGTAWVRAGYVKLTNSTNSNTSYIDSFSFAFRMLEWHVAGGECIYGLLNRRLAETKIFLYGEYEQAYYNHAEYGANKYKFVYPSCMAQYQ